MEDILNSLDELIWEQQNLVIDNLNTGIYVAEIGSYRLLFANRFLKQLFEEDIIGKTCHEVFWNSAVPCSFCSVDKLIIDGKPQPPYVWEHQDRTKKWFRFIDRAIKWSDGRYVRLQISIDIDEHKRMKQELIRHQNHLQELVDERTLELQQEIAKHKQVMRQLKKSEDRYKALVKSLPVGLYQADSAGVCVYTTAETGKMLGVTIEDMLGPNWANILHPEDKERVVAKWRSGAQRQEPFNEEYRFVRPDGSFIWVKALANPYIDDDQKLSYVGTLTDITEVKEKEVELRISGERFAKTFNNCPSAMSIVSLNDFTYIDVNERWVDLVGYSRQEVIGSKLGQHKIWVDDRRIRELIKMVLDNGAFYNEELTLISKVGELHIGLTSAVTINLAGKKCVSIVVHDITDQKIMEKELNRMDRLNLVGQMAAGIGHEVRNPMTTVRGLLQILSVKPECAQYKEHYDLMISELDRANSIITEYLSLAKKEVTYLKLLNINPIIESLFPLLMADALNSSKNVVLQLRPTQDLMLDQKEIRQLILNLVRNGLEAMSSGGKLTLSTYMEDKQVILAVKDEGIGIDSDVLDKLGTPFFTTKAEGTGLGLATCYSIAERHHAKINIETGPQGTTFYVMFENLQIREVINQ